MTAARKENTRLEDECRAKSLQLRNLQADYDKALVLIEDGNAGLHRHHQVSQDVEHAVSEATQAAEVRLEQVRRGFEYDNKAAEASAAAAANRAQKELAEANDACQQAEEESEAVRETVTAARKENTRLEDNYAAQMAVLETQLECTQHRLDQQTRVSEKHISYLRSHTELSHVCQVATTETEAGIDQQFEATLQGLSQSLERAKRDLATARSRCQEKEFAKRELADQISLLQSAASVHFQESEQMRLQLEQTESEFAVHCLENENMRREAVECRGQIAVLQLHVERLRLDNATESEIFTSEMHESELEVAATKEKLDQVRRGFECDIKDAEAEAKAAAEAAELTWAGQRRELQAKEFAEQEAAMQARSRQQEELEAVALIEQEVAVERRDAAQNLADALDACKQATAKYGEEKQLVEQLRLQLKQQIATCMTEQKQHSDELSKSLSDSDRFSDEAARTHKYVAELKSELEMLQCHTDRQHAREIDEVQRAVAASNAAEQLLVQVRCDFECELKEEKQARHLAEDASKQLSSALEAAELTCAKLETENVAQKEEIDSTQAKVARAESMLAQHRSECNKMQRETAHLQGKMSYAESGSASAQLENQRIKLQLEESCNQVATMQSIVGEMQQERQSLEQQMAAVEASAVAERDANTRAAEAKQVQLQEQFELSMKHCLEVADSKLVKATTQAEHQEASLRSALEHKSATHERELADAHKDHEATRQKLSENRHEHARSEQHERRRIADLESKLSIVTAELKSSSEWKEVQRQREEERQIFHSVEEAQEAHVKSMNEMQETLNARSAEFRAALNLERQARLEAQQELTTAKHAADRLHVDLHKTPEWTESRSAADWPSSSQNVVAELQKEMDSLRVQLHHRGLDNRVCPQCNTTCVSSCLTRVCVCVCVFYFFQGLQQQVLELCKTVEEHKKQLVSKYLVIDVVSVFSGIVRLSVGFACFIMDRLLV